MTPLDAARLSQAAYTTMPTIGDVDSAARAVATCGVVSFPGTNNVACWLADLDVGTDLIPGFGVLHSGFWHAFDSIRVPLRALPDIEVLVGHSEGAALAILAAADRCLAGRPPKTVYAFEAPRVSADQTLAKLFAEHRVDVRIYRNGNDVVPMIPRILHAWQHSAAVINIGKASWPVPNVDDHLIEQVIRSLSGRVN